MGRRVSDTFTFRTFSRRRRLESLDHEVVSHRSLLLRKLSGTDMELQRNKVRSLDVACRAIDGMLIMPSETFSFWKSVGRPTERRGFLPGLQLSGGKMTAMTGGGLCQLSNLLYWMVLQTNMEVTERHRHDFDPFPDYRRTVPFGTGATVFWNYKDLRFCNDGFFPWQVRVWVDEEYLEGRLLGSSLPETELSIEERRHRFVRMPDGTVYRENELWRVEHDRETGERLGESLLIRNRARVAYDVDGVPGIEVEEVR